jgi:hypothetical protein
VVYAAAVLLHFPSHESNGKVEVVGLVFRKESYGIVFRQNSAYRKRVNQALLTLRKTAVTTNFPNSVYGALALGCYFGCKAEPNPSFFGHDSKEYFHETYQHREYLDEPQKAGVKITVALLLA